MTGAADRSIDLLFGGAYALSEGSEAALEDYARAVAQAEEAEALRKGEGPGGVSESSGRDRAEVRGVCLVAPRAALSAEVIRDVEDFARGLAQDGRNDRLGWS